MDFSVLIQMMKSFIQMELIILKIKVQDRLKRKFFKNISIGYFGLYKVNKNDEIFNKNNKLVSIFKKYKK